MRCNKCKVEYEYSHTCDVTVIPDNQQCNIIIPRYTFTVSIYDTQEQKQVEKIGYNTDDLDEIASTFRSIIIRKLSE